MEESTWELAEELAEAAAGAVDDFWAAHLLPSVFSASPEASRHTFEF
jgi:hypothetical protein